MTNPSNTVTPEMPTLRIVPTDTLVLHERMDAQRSIPLSNRLRAEGILRNPPVVAPIYDHPDRHEGQRYVVLDGANRTTALRQLNIPAVLVQIIEYDSPRVHLFTWSHVICQLEREELLQGIQDIDGLALKETTLPSAQAGLSRRQILAFLAHVNGTVLAAHPEAGDLSARTELLNNLVNTYQDRCCLYRANTDQPSEVLDYYEDVAALVVFPRFRPAELRTLARDGITLPPGITRHVIAGRALRLDYPLDKLARPTSLQEKNVRLTAWIKERMARKAVRYYEEPTFLFDE